MDEPWSIAERRSEWPPAVILAGGFGTRLREVLPDLPKPLAPVAGRPFIEYLILQLTRSGIDRIVISSGYMAHLLESQLEDGSTLGAHISYSREERPLGTGGAAALAVSMLIEDASDTCIVMNGDSYCEVDFGAMLEQFYATGANAMITVRHVDDSRRFGLVDIDPATSEITGFQEKAELEAPGWINGGIYLLRSSLLEEIPANQAVSIEREFFPSLVGRGLYAFKTDGLFIDIGIPSELERAQTLFADMR